MRRALLQDGDLMAEGNHLSLLSGTGPKRGGDQSQKSDEKWSHRGNHDDLTNGAKTCIFNPDGIFGIHRRTDPRPTGRYQHLTTFRSVDAMHFPVQGIGGFASSAPSEQTRDVPSPPPSAEEFIMTVRGG